MAGPDDEITGRPSDLQGPIAYVDARRRTRVAGYDAATLLGLAGAVALLAWVMFAGAGEAVTVFWRTPSVALVLGGALLATLIAFPAGRLRTLADVIRGAVCDRSRDPQETIASLVVLAGVARREGLLALDRRVDRIEDPFLQQAMRMAIDGVDPATIESVMTTRLEAIEHRHRTGREMIESVGRFAPVFGMIGTVIGLVVMLGRMDDPSKIGPGMAVALLTTLYGLVLAHVFCWPIARKLKYRSHEELLHKTIAVRGVLAVQAGDHPRLVEQKLRAYLPGEPDAPALPPLPPVIEPAETELPAAAPPEVHEAPGQRFVEAA